MKKNKPLDIKPREQRKYNLTPLGHEACRWFDQQEKASAPLPMDTLPHIELKKVQS